MSRASTLNRLAGFTLVELIVTMVIVGVLAAVVMPRFMGREGFESRGFFDQAQSVVRYAQKTAIAQHRNALFVVITASNVSACYDAACTLPVIHPSTGAALTATAPTPVSMAPALTFSYNALGQPSFAVDQTITLTTTSPGDVNRIFNIARETGYVSHP